MKQMFYYIMYWVAYSLMWYQIKKDATITDPVACVSNRFVACMYGLQAIIMLAGIFYDN